MATPKKLDLYIAYFCYGGNGGISTIHPDIMDWLLLQMPALLGDARVGTVGMKRFSDTPITMTRNEAIQRARKGEVDFCLKSPRPNGSGPYDLILMIDSDMGPDCELLAGDTTARPFLPTAFNFLYEQHGLRPAGAMIAAPYCGPPPNEIVYIFLWKNNETQPIEVAHGFGASYRMFEREEAAERTGIEAVGALPTGLYMADMRLYELTDPVDEKDEPHHYYEWRDKYAAEKCSTEDVVVTRDIALACVSKHGYNPVHVAWDSWAAHWKPKKVRKPQPLKVDHVKTKLQRAVRCGIPSDRRVLMANFEANSGVSWDNVPSSGPNGEAYQEATSESR